MVEPGPQIIYKPTDEDKAKCYEFGREFARKVKEYNKKYE